MEQDSSSVLLAHNLEDSTTLRSSDVILDEDVSFSDLLLSSGTLAGLKACGFERPSPIQLETIPLGRCGFDMMVQSKAGTGKTCIFTVIALENLRHNLNGHTQTLIIAPTREIAIQIHETITLVGQTQKDLKCVLCIGGISVKEDRQRLSQLNCPSKQSTTSKSCQIVVGTPGRIKQLIGLNLLKTHQVELFVLDEADKLLDDQFKSQIDDIYKNLPLDKQIIATSATYSDELAQFLQQYMQSPKCIRLGREVFLEAISEFYIESKAGHSYKKNVENKLQLLKRILNHFTTAKCFIFTNYQTRAPVICEDLNQDADFVAKYGTVSYICAELSQADRNVTFDRFRTSSNQKLLISTDVSARGIDIRDIELVINFDLPPDRATYYHRIGRAGRFGQPGKAVSIVSGDSVDKSLFKKSILSERINKLTLADEF